MNENSAVLQVLSPTDAQGATLSPALLQRLEPPLQSAEALIRAYEQADVLVLLSDYEGLPLTILEAMRQGVVVIATDVGEVVRDGENGILLPLAQAVPACLSALQSLSTSPDLLRRLSDRAAKDMAGRDWQSASRAFIARLTARDG